MREPLLFCTGIIAVKGAIRLLRTHDAFSCASDGLRSSSSTSRYLVCSSTQLHFENTIVVV